MFAAECEQIDSQRHRYTLWGEGRAMSFRDVLQRWQCDDAFNTYFTALLAESPFAAFRWETPGITRKLVDRPFEFVLLDAPRLGRPADPLAFQEHFTDADVEHGVVAFESLGRDARLIVPSPRGTQLQPYVHLAAFLRGATAEQIHAVWRVTSRAMLDRLSPEPLWLSTAGGGVAWLHVRLDSRPKYYGHAPYRASPDDVA